MSNLKSDTSKKDKKEENNIIDELLDIDNLKKKNFIFRFILNPNYLPKIFSIVLFLLSIATVAISVHPFLEKIKALDPIINQSHNFVENFSFNSKSSILRLVIAYLLFFIARGLWSKKRIAWIFGCIMLTVLTLNSYLSSISTIYAFFYGFILILFLLSYRVFNVESKNLYFQYSQVLVLISFIAALFYGVIGTYLLKDDFTNINNFSDAFYFTLVTYSTVGYGDTYPITSDAKLFVSSMIFIGLGIFAAVLTVVIVPLFEGRMKKIFRVVRGRGFYMNNHIIIFGNTILAKELVLKYLKDKKEFILVSDENFMNLPDIIFLQGNANDDDILDEIKVQKSKSIIVSYENDAENILAALSIKDSLLKKKETDLILCMNDVKHVEKAKHCGADKVILPYVLAADEILENFS